jgi:hypothetical protein
VRKVAAVAAVALGLAPAASAETTAQVQALALRAQHDPSALARLGQVRIVDGRRADLRAALDGASAVELQARLRTLAAGGERSAIPPGARGTARGILRESRFRGSAVPRPLHRPLQWLGRQLRKVFGPVGRLADRMPGGRAVFWLLIASIVVAAAVVGGVRVGRRRGGRLLELGEQRTRGRRADPARLEREADDAEARGDLERALRLRFRAGLLRLGRADAIPLRESLTSGEVRRLIASPAFDTLAHDHDEVVYGGATAGREHVVRARECWPRVLEEARR